MENQTEKPFVVDAFIASLPKEEVTVWWQPHHSWSRPHNYHSVITSTNEQLLKLYSIQSDGNKILWACVEQTQDNMKLLTRLINPNQQNKTVPLDMAYDLFDECLGFVGVVAFSVPYGAIWAAIPWSNLYQETSTAIKAEWAFLLGGRVVFQDMNLDTILPFDGMEWSEDEWSDKKYGRWFDGKGESCK